MCLCVEGTLDAELVAGIQLVVLCTIEFWFATPGLHAGSYVLNIAVKTTC